MERIAVVIPARMASSRFPGKPLAPILGLPMIEHVRRRAQFAQGVQEVVVATCDESIAKTVEEAGGRVLMTFSSHLGCLDRTAEAASKLKADIVVNLQGDEPCVLPEMLEEVVKPLLADKSLGISNLMSLVRTDPEYLSPDAVKVALDLKDRALYFSREPIPSSKKSAAQFPRFKQLGIMAFRSEVLAAFAKLEPSPLEKIESVDMLRALEHGMTVQMIPTEKVLVGVDRPEDVAKAEAMLRRDVLIHRYHGETQGAPR